MKVTIRTLIEAKPALEKLLAADLPVQAAFLLKRLFRALTEEFGHFNTEREELVKKYIVKDEAGNDTVDKGNQEFLQAVEALIKCEVELKFEPVSHDLLGDVKMSAIDMDRLDAFII